MFVSILFKTLYTLLLWFLILPIIKKKGIFQGFAGIIILLLTFETTEILVSNEFRIFSLEHMILHPSLIIWLSLVIYLVITLICFALYFIRESFRNERQKKELIETQLTTELQFLHAQINPHFLFNTLNNLFSVAQRDKNKELAESISMLSGLMRYMIYDIKSTGIPLRQELNRISDFIGLYRLRFRNDEVLVNFDIKGNIDKHTIAPMVLLTFVENAFKHGIKIEEKSRIDISITAENDTIKFRSYNNKHGYKYGFLESSGIGLENVKRRLALLYPDRHKLEINDTQYFFEVKLTINV